MNSPERLGRAIFLDRDGVLIRDCGYTYKPEDLQFFPDVAETLKSWQAGGYKLFIVTNQSGIGRGYFDETQYQIFHQHLVHELKLSDVLIDDMRFCPHHVAAVVEKYRKDCDCRKPKPGMILDLLQTHQIDAAQSFMIGDKESDIEAGLQAGVRSIQLAHVGVHTEKDFHAAAAAIVSDLPMAYRIINAYGGR